VKSYADDVERVEREHRQRMKKSEAAFNRRYNDISVQLKSQQVLFLLHFLIFTECFLCAKAATAFSAS